MKNSQARNVSSPGYPQKDIIVAIVSLCELRTAQAIIGKQLIFHAQLITMQATC
jgi:hypothetical protein